MVILKYGTGQYYHVGIILQKPKYAFFQIDLSQKKRKYLFRFDKVHSPSIWTIYGQKPEGLSQRYQNRTTNWWANRKLAGKPIGSDLVDQQEIN